MTNDEQYVPSDDDVRARASMAPPGHAVESVWERQRAEFDRWLRAHDARVRRDAWTEGCRAAEQYYRRTVVGIPGLDPIPAPVNPHEETP